MASIQQLEKLYHIQSICHAEQSLESAVASERVAQAIQRTEQLIRRKAFLREERRSLRLSSERTEQQAAALRVMQRSDWIPQGIRSMVISPKNDSANVSSNSTTTAGSNGDQEKQTTNTNAAAIPTAPSSSSAKETTVRINITGLMFETPVSVIMKDPASLLAQLCNNSPTASPPVLADPEGFFYFERDWWIFRYILQFLRDGTLPDDRPLLAQLYREGAFFKLQELQTAIEEEKLHLRDKGSNDKEENKRWWRKLPNWTQAVDEEKKHEADSKKKKADWWTDSMYMGKIYLPLSDNPNKVVTMKGQKDEKHIPSGTW
eukprot:CAMPEP_0119052112 /NCGR_PEP_ID=MMETSP1177-20130426/73521_1 /TAXON_ID=2985 /ORGANISM="Ochromonas sp, Strain CCMP1899" /LENGTH=317 /DNA_ID=CAMNT_0007031573 /DNA_START=53 /DNA_END=1003 /DNA_ORIENTATION=-